MTWDLHADAARISSSSPAIKAFAQHVADILQPVTPPPNVPTVKYTGGDFDAFVRSIPNGGLGVLQANGKLTRSIRPDDGCAPVFALASDPQRGPFELSGAADVRSGCVVTFNTLRLHESGAPGTRGASWVIASPCQFVRCDLTNDGTKIGLIVNPGSRGWKVDRCHFHAIGQTNPDDNGQHGIYDESGEAGVVTDTLLETCADRGIQLRISSGTQVQNVTVQNCGEGVIFGDLTTRGDRVNRSILRNNRVVGRFLLEALGDVAGCVVDDNYIYNDDGRQAIQPGLVGVTVTNTHTGTPAAGYGPRFPVGC